MRAPVNGVLHRVLSNLRRIIGQTIENRFADLEYGEVVEILDGIFEKSAESSDCEFVQPYLDTMAAMGIGKLADLADSLIQLQLMSTHADTERTTIGGTIEVAAIKRQHEVRWVSKLKEDVLIGH